MTALRIYGKAVADARQRETVCMVKITSRNISGIKLKGRCLKNLKRR